MKFFKIILKLIANGKLILLIAFIIWFFLIMRLMMDGVPRHITILNPNELAPVGFEWFASYMTQEKYDKYCHLNLALGKMGFFSAIIGLFLHVIWQKLHGKDIYSWK